MIRARPIAADPCSRAVGRHEVFRRVLDTRSGPGPGLEPSCRKAVSHAVASTSYDSTEPKRNYGRHAGRSCGEESVLYQNMNRIKRAEALTDLCELVLAEGWTFTGANIGYALAQLFKLYVAENDGPQLSVKMSSRTVDRTMVLPTLHALDSLVMAEADSFEAWDVALSLWAYSGLGHFNQAVFERLSQHGVSVQEQLNPADCSMIMTAFGRLGHYHPSLLRTIPEAMLANLDDSKPHEVSQVVWGFAKLGVSFPSLKALCDAVMDLTVWKIDHFGCQELVIILWSLAKLEQSPHLQFMQQIESTLIQLLPYLNPQDVSNALYSFVKLRYKPLHFMAAAPACMIPRLHEFKPNEISQLLYAYTQCRHYSPVMLNALAPVISSKLHQMSTHDVTTALWCYGTFLHHPPTWKGDRERLRSMISELPVCTPDARMRMQQPDASSPFITMLSLVALHHLQYMRTQALALTIKAYARLGGDSGHPLVAAIAQSAEEKIEQSACRPDDISSIMFGLSTLKHTDLKIYHACVRHCIRLLESPGHPSTDQKLMGYVLNSVVKSCRRVGYTPWTLFDFAESRGIRLRQLESGLSISCQNSSLPAAEVDQSRLNSGGAASAILFQPDSSLPECVSTSNGWRPSSETAEAGASHVAESVGQDQAETRRLNAQADGGPGSGEGEEKYAFMQSALLDTLGDERQQQLARQVDSKSPWIQWEKKKLKRGRRKSKRKSKPVDASIEGSAHNLRTSSVDWPEMRLQDDAEHDQGGRRAGFQSAASMSHSPGHFVLETSGGSFSLGSAPHLSDGEQLLDGAGSNSRSSNGETRVVS